MDPPSPSSQDAAADALELNARCGCGLLPGYPLQRARFLLKWGGPNATPSTNGYKNSCWFQSSSSVGPRLRADFLASSDTPLDVGGRPTNRPRDALGGGTGGNLSAPAGGGGAAATAAVAAADAAGKGIGMAMRRRRLRAVRGRLGTDDAASATPPPPSPPPVACPAAFLAAGAAGGGIATAAVAGGAAGADDAASTEAAARAAGAAAPIMR